MSTQEVAPQQRVEALRMRLRDSSIRGIGELTPDLIEAFRQEFNLSDERTEILYKMYLNVEEAKRFAAMTEEEKLAYLSKKSNLTL